MKKGYVYILSNYNRTALYIGMTNDIENRILEHKAGIGSQHTAKYKLKYLMYFEECPSIQVAISREKQLKNWNKEWKWNLIKENNPDLWDLATDWFDEVDIESVKTGRFLREKDSKTSS
jgi:putative endonuclease